MSQKFLPFKSQPTPLFSTAVATAKACFCVAGGEGTVAEVLRS